MFDRMIEFTINNFTDCGVSLLLTTTICRMSPNLWANDPNRAARDEITRTRHVGNHLVFGPSGHPRRPKKLSLFVIESTHITVLRLSVLEGRGGYYHMIRWW